MSTAHHLAVVNSSKMFSIKSKAITCVYLDAKILRVFTFRLSNKNYSYYSRKSRANRYKLYFTTFELLKSDIYCCKKYNIITSSLPKV